MRKRLWYIFLLGVTLVFFVASPSFSQETQETLTFTTYYPSPIGIYRELRSQRLAVGDTYYDAGQHPWDDEDLDNQPTEISQDADLVVEGNVGIGTTNPSEKLEIASDVDADLDLLTANDGSTDTPTIHLKKAKGTLSSLQPVQQGNSLAAVDGMGYTGSSFTRAAEISFDVDGTPQAGVVPGRLEFKTKPEGWTGSEWPPLRMVIRSDGNVGIGTAAPQTTSPTNNVATGNLDVNDVYLRSRNLWVSQMAGPQVGAYTGDGTANRKINVSFRPSVLKIYVDGTGDLNYIYAKSSAMPSRNSFRLSSGGVADEQDLLTFYEDATGKGFIVTDTAAHLWTPQ